MPPIKLVRISYVCMCGVTADPSIVIQVNLSFAPSMSLLHLPSSVLNLIDWFEGLVLVMAVLLITMIFFRMFHVMQHLASMLSPTK